MKQLKILSFILIIASCIACTKADPKIDAGGDSLSLKLDTALAKINSTSAPIIIAGDCDKRMSSIEVSINGGAWADATTLTNTHSIRCSSMKRFSLTLDPSSSAISSYLGFISNVLDSKKIKLRGKTVLGSGRSSDFTVTYEPLAQAPEGAYITSANSNGSRFLSSSVSSYKLQGRLGAQSEALSTNNLSSTTGFVLKSGMQRTQ